MISPDSQGGPDIALITLICGWTFFAAALIGVSLVLWWLRATNRRIGSDQYITVLALMTSLVLMAQTTWAIVDEGQDDHELEISKTRLALVVRVCQSALARNCTY